MSNYKTHESPLNREVRWQSSEGREIEAAFECDADDQDVKNGRKTIFGHIVSAIGNSIEAVLKISGTSDNPTYLVEDIDEEDFK